MTWFEQLFGFTEGSWAHTQQQFRVSPAGPSQSGDELVSLANQRRFAIGQFSTPSIADLQSACKDLPRGRLRLRHAVIGDVLALHGDPANAGALFQVASQFNCLEFPGPDVVPEDGVTGYAHDLTQGPACSLAAAAATVYRNYFAPVGGQRGQTRDRQINNLADVATLVGEPLFQVRNGYTFSTGAQLQRLAVRMAAMDRESLVGAVRIGVHSGVGVTFASRWHEPQRDQRVSQAFCSAVSCGYANLDTALWQPLATLALDAAYEGTLRAAALDHAQGRGSGKVWLTFVGGGVFANDRAWIAHAIDRAARVCADLPLDVHVAHFRSLNAYMVGAIAPRT